MKYLRLGVGWMLLAGMPLGWCVRKNETDRNDSPIRLRDAVEVRRSQVWLSDLLPSDAPPVLQKASAAIALCLSPQPGSIRLLDGGQVTSMLAGQPKVLRQLVIPSRIMVRYAGWPITEAAVRGAISKFLHEEFLPEQAWKRDLPDGAQFGWVQPMSAAEEHPRLQVTGLEWDNRQQSLQARLRCLIRTSCSSFLVHVVLPAPLGEAWRQRMGPGSAPNSASGQPGSGNETVLAEKGKPATLILDDGSMRISLRVMCLQPGVLNQQIRVVEAKSQRVFHAEVVGAGLLHAAL
jgi:hypothetical protein